MNADQRLRRAVRDLADAVPVVAPPAVALRERRASRLAQARRRWLVPALAGAAVAAVLLVAVVPGWLPSPVAIEPSSTTDQPMLPERFAGKGWRTANATDAPPGPAIATFTQGTGWSAADLVIVGADGRTYRRLSLADLHSLSTGRGHDVRDPLLSPDGTRLAGSGGYLIDLATMTGQWQPILPGDTRSSWGANPLLAWSPDGRRLVYSVAAEDMPRPPGSRPADEGLALLDLVTGAVQFIGTDGAGPRVAFSPDGSELAVSTVLGWRRTTVKVYDLSGQLLRELRPPPAHELPLGGAGWSPDGALLVMVEPGYWPGRFSFVDATGQGRAVPEPWNLDDSSLVEMVGWRGPDTLLVGAYPRGVGDLRWLLEVPVAAAPAVLVEPFVISEFAVNDRNHVADLRVASGLLAEAETGDPGRPRHGPLPTWLWVVAGMVAGALVVAPLVWRRLVA